MANAVRVDDVVIQKEGQIEVKFTSSETPLSIEASGEGLVFNSRQQLAEEIEAAEKRIIADLLFIQLAKGLKLDPNISQNFVSAVRGKSTMIDLTGTATLISIQ